MSEESVEPGFEIRGEFYPLTTDFSMGDPKLVTDVSGMEWLEFLRGVSAGDWYGPVLGGLVAVAIWHKNPVWRRDKVSDFVQRLSESEVTPIGIYDDDPQEKEAEDPPAGAESPGKTNSAKSPNGSSSTPESQPEPQTPATTGTPDSIIGVPA